MLLLTVKIIKVKINTATLQLTFVPPVQDLRLCYVWYCSTIKRTSSYCNVLLVWSASSDLWPLNLGLLASPLFLTASVFFDRTLSQFWWSWSVLATGKLRRKERRCLGRGSSLSLRLLLAPRHFLIDILHKCCRGHTRPGVCACVCVCVVPVCPRS